MIETENSMRNRAKREPQVRSSDLLEAESTLAALSKQMATECQLDGKTWQRDWMQKHANDRAALIKVQTLLMDRAEASNTELSEGAERNSLE